MTTTTGWTAQWILFYKSFGKITTFRKSFIRRIFAYKGSFDFDWITHRQFDGQPILCGENILRRTWYQQRLRAHLYFSIGKITTLTTALMHSFRVWYVQCFWLNSSIWKFDGYSILLQWKIYWRTGQQRHRPRVCKIQRLSFQNCLAVSTIFGRETILIKFNESHGKFDDFFTCAVKKLIKLIRNRLLTVV